MAARVHNVFSLAEILKIFLSETTKSIEFMLDFKSAPKHKSGRGPSSEHFCQVLLISVQRFQRRRFKCEKLTDGRRRTLPMTKAHMVFPPGELKKLNMELH
jgi:hypothetical protein